MDIQVCTSKAKQDTESAIIESEGVVGDNASKESQGVSCVIGLMSSDQENEPKSFVSVASISVTQRKEKARSYGTDLDDSGDNLDDYQSSTDRAKSSGFSGDDEEGFGEEGPSRSPPGGNKGGESECSIKVTTLERVYSAPVSSASADIDISGKFSKIRDDNENPSVKTDSEPTISQPQSAADISISPNSSFDSQNSNSGANPIPNPKPTRIPWTTRLIQKLTEEETHKKLRTEERLKQARKTRIPPKRSAIYERTDKSSPWLQRPTPNKNLIPVPVERSKGAEKVERSSLITADTSGGKHVIKKFGKECEESDLNNSDQANVCVSNKVNKDRYAEIITELVLKNQESVKEITSQEQVVSEELSKSNLVGSPRSIVLPKSYLNNSEPKVSPPSSTNIRRNPQADISSDTSPSRRQFLETAFLSVSPTRNLQDTEEDLMFRKIESKFSSGHGGFRRHKSLTNDETKPKISPKPDVKPSLPVKKQLFTSPKTTSSEGNGNEHSNPIYANDVFFRKRRQQGFLHSNQSPANIVHNSPDDNVLSKQDYENNSPGVTDRQAGSRGIALVRGRPVAPRTVDSVEYRKATQFEARQNQEKSRPNEPDFAHQTNSKFNEYVKDYKDIHPSSRSSSSSTSTIVSEAPWDPDSVDLEKTAISGSPEIRKLQSKQRPEHERSQSNDYNRNVIDRNVYYTEEQRIRSQLPLKIQTDNFVVQQQYQSIPSGRVSAPPLPYHEYSRRLTSPVPAKTDAPLHSSPKQTSVDNVKISPRGGIPVQISSQRHMVTTPEPKSQKYYSLDSGNGNYYSRNGIYGPTHSESGRLLVPVGAQMKITSAQGEIKRAEPIPTRELLQAQSLNSSPRGNEKPVKLSPNLTQKQQEEIYMQRIQKSRSLPYKTTNITQINPNSSLNRSFSPPANYRKLSRQEVEQLYWQTQQMRELHASQLSPRSAKIYLDQYHSTGSLKSQHFHSPQRSDENSKMINQSVPNLKMSNQNISNLQGTPVVNSVPNLSRASPQVMYYANSSGLVVKPQPVYDSKQYAEYQTVAMNRQLYLQNLNDGRIRSRSVSPGPNNKYYMNSSPSSLNSQRGSPQQSPQGRNVPDNATNFVRGTPQRNTIGAIRTSRPQTPLQSTTIYENTTGVFGPEVQLRHPEKLRVAPIPVSKIPNGTSKTDKNKNESSKKPKEEKKKDKKGKEKEKEKVDQFYPPIFKRGSLVSMSNSSVDSTTDSPSAPKRVSFSNGQDSGGFSPEQVYWPTRNGLAPEPPTRQHKQRPESDSEVFLPDPPMGQYYQKGDYIYMAANNRPVYRVVHSDIPHEAPDRPLPPIPAHGHPQYGSISKPSDLKSPVGQTVRASTAPGSKLPTSTNRWQPISESESGSEAGEVQRILQQGNRHVTYFRFAEEEWGADGKPRGPPGSDQSGSSGGGRDDEVRRGAGARGSRRDEPRRHTLSGDHHHQGGALARSMDLEMSSKQRRKSPLPRGYPPPSSAMLFDDDPGIMSEVETSSTGFRRGGKQRSSLPVVRTPSKTLERPLGLVFLQYRNETKRALLPNEITSLDTVRALFVRSFPKQLTMEYLDSHHVKIYIHDSSKDMFYELEDLRSHLRDIRDRSVLRLFESADVNGGVLPGAGVGVAPPIWDQDQSYFSEPEFDSEYQHQHIHKSKSSSKSSGGQPYYMTHSYPPGGVGAPATLPRGGSLLRAYSPAAPPPLPADRIKSLPQSGVGPPPKPVRTYHQPQGLVARGNQPIYGSFVNSSDRRDQSSIYASPDRLHSESGYMSSPERGGPRGSYPPGYLPGGGSGAYEDPYYSQYASRSGSITPVIDEEARASLSRIRVEHMERQLANLTGLVQKALTHTPTPREYLQVPIPSSRDANNYRNAADDYDKHSSSSSASLPDEAYLRTDTKPPKLGKDKSVSFEKSVSFSDEPPDMNSPKQHSPQHSERNDRDRHKPAPPPKPVSLSPAQYEGRHIYRDLQMTPELYNQLRGLQKKAKDLRTEVRNLRRMSQAQAHSVRETIRDTFIKIRAVLVAGGAEAWATGGDHEKLRLTRDEDLYKQEMLRLETDLTELESTVEELRGNVINRKTRVNMSDVENMALVLSKSSKTVADLKVRFPGLQEGMKGLLSSEMEKVVREEKFLNEEPERLESALRRCKKLTGTLVTLKRLASVQEQRLPPSSTPESRLSPTMDSDSTPPITPPAHGKTGSVSTRGVLAPALSTDSLARQRPENALDALLDELQTFARPPSTPSLADIGRKGSVDSQQPPNSGGTLRRLHSYPSSSDGGGSSPPTLSRLKPPVPERNAELLAQLAGRRQPPPPPPRTSSRSPLASPTSPSLPPRVTPQMGTLRRGAPGRSSLREPLRTGSPSETARPTEETNPGFNPLSASNSSSCESVNSQEGLQPKSGKQRQEVLEQRHQELLRKQKALQEQYARLQQLQRGAGSLSVPPPDLLLKKTGSESNLLAKMGLGHNLSAAAPISGSLTHLAVSTSQPITAQTQALPPLASMKLQAAPTSTTTTTNKIYETDIL